jgi:DNA-binding Lrp family transcriptional regulator
MGLSDCIILMEMPEDMPTMPKGVFEAFPMFYGYGLTMGKFNGYMVASVLSSYSPEVVDSAIEAFQDHGLIKTYYVFINRDYTSLPPDFTKLRKSGTWDWSWQEWVENAEKIIKAEAVLPFELDLNNTPIDFDDLDVEMLKTLKVDARPTLKELGSALGLSESQVGVRLRRLEDEGIIKDYRWIIGKAIESTSIHCYFETTDAFHPVLNVFRDLPFPKELIAETDRKFSVRCFLHANSLADYLKGLANIRKYTKSLFIQTLSDVHSSPMEEIYKLYNRRSNRWEIRVDEYIKEMERVLKG